jgi:hypothetical protein
MKRIESIKVNGIVKFVNTNTENEYFEFADNRYVQIIELVFLQYIHCIEEEKQIFITTTLDKINIHTQMPPKHEWSSCPFCLDKKCNVLSNCGHSFCEKCISQNLYKGAKCPQCKTLITRLTVSNYVIMTSYTFAHF